MEMFLLPFLYAYAPGLMVSYLVTFRLTLLIGIIATQVISDRRKWQRHKDAPIFQGRSQLPLELTPEEQATGWWVERNEDGTRYKALIIEDGSPRRRPFLERHKGPYLTKEDITRWWEELKDHEF